jgi:hypothetical protein
VDALFRAALFEQLGEARLEPAVTTDIAGKDHAHAVRLDTEATAEVKKARLHRKVATSILFESNGGQQRGEATLAEVRLAVAEPGLDIGSVEQCLEARADLGTHSLRRLQDLVGAQEVEDAEMVDRRADHEVRFQLLELQCRDGLHHQLACTEGGVHAGRQAAMPVTRQADDIDRDDDPAG